jgi:hypothetical protein
MSSLARDQTISKYLATERQKSLCWVRDQCEFEQNE